MFLSERVSKNVRSPRVELGTSTLSVSRSNQLSYDRIDVGLFPFGRSSNTLEARRVELLTF